VPLKSRLCIHYNRVRQNLLARFFPFIRQSPVIVRKNLPVTQNEQLLSPGQKLISSTDLQGRIRHCNQAFLDISGFSRDELIGQPHNIVRHPDMPPAAYENMWSYLKAGRPWMGLVKNRCKNGDFYWVSAYITPVTEAGRVVGYESVRSCPDRQDVARAAKLYDRINKGGKVVRWWQRVPFVPVAAFAGLLVAISLGIAGSSVAAFTLLALTLVFSVTLGQMKPEAMRDSVLSVLDGSFSDMLAAQSYTDDSPEQGRLKVAVMAQRAHLDAVLTRLEDSAAEVTSRSVSGREIAHETQQALLEQQCETEQVAAAVHEMSTTIGEVSSNVQSTANKAEESRGLALEGKTGMESSRKVIEKLKLIVDEIRQSVTELADQTGSIASAAGINGAWAILLIWPSKWQQPWKSRLKCRIKSTNRFKIYQPSPRGV
jgi:aerotaxis receptor